MKNRFLSALGLALALAVASPLVLPPSASAVVPTITSSATDVTEYVGNPLTYQIVATNTPTSYANTGPTLPAGLSLNTSTGLISGTPTAAANVQAVLRATNADGNSATINKRFIILVGVYNRYTNRYEAAGPTPSPNGTPTVVVPSDNPNAGAPDKVPIVGGPGGYIPNDPKTVAALQALVGVDATAPKPFTYTGTYPYSSAATLTPLVLIPARTDGSKVYVTRAFYKVGGTAFTGSGSIGLTLTGNSSSYLNTGIANLGNGARGELGTVYDFALAPAANEPLKISLTGAGNPSTGSDVTYFVTGFIK